MKEILLIQWKKEAMIQTTVEFLDTLLLTTLLLVQQIKLYRGLYLKRSNSLLNLNQDKIMDKDFQVVMDTTQWDIINLIIVMIYKHSWVIVMEKTMQNTQCLLLIWIWIKKVWQIIKDWIMLGNRLIKTILMTLQSNRMNLNITIIMFQSKTIWRKKE